MTNKIVPAASAAAPVHAGDTVTTSGFVGAGVPDALLKALADRFEAEGGPRDLTLIFAAGQGDGEDRGLNRLAAPGLGVVIIQVDQAVAGGSLPAREMVISGALVDAVVLTPPDLHAQTYATRYFTNRYKAPEGVAALNAEAIIAQNQQFDFYDGGGLDLACLGMAEAGEGNVNVSRFGPKPAGAGDGSRPCSNRSGTRWTWSSTTTGRGSTRRSSTPGTAWWTASKRASTPRCRATRRRPYGAAPPSTRASVPPRPL